jgi:hypothetical protein
MAGLRYVEHALVPLAGAEHRDHGESAPHTRLITSDRRSRPFADRFHSALRFGSRTPSASRLKTFATVRRATLLAIPSLRSPAALVDGNVCRTNRCHERLNPISRPSELHGRRSLLGHRARPDHTLQADQREANRGKEDRPADGDSNPDVARRNRILLSEAYSRRARRHTDVVRCLARVRQRERTKPTPT